MYCSSRRRTQYRRWRALRDVVVCSFFLVKCTIYSFYSDDKHQRVHLIFILHNTHTQQRNTTLGKWREVLFLVVVVFSISLLLLFSPLVLSSFQVYLVYMYRWWELSPETPNGGTEKKNTTSSFSRCPPCSCKLKERKKSNRDTKKKR